MSQVANVNAGAVAGYQSMLGGLANVAKSSSPRRGGSQFLRLLKTKEWVYGAEDTHIDPNTLWAVNLLSFSHGWTCWDRRKKEDGGDTSKGPIQEVMVPSNAVKPLLQELTDHSAKGGEWVEQQSVELIGVGGKDDGVKLTYKAHADSSSEELIGLVHKLIQNFNPETPVPLITLGATTFKSRTYGQIAKPVFTLVKWIANDPANAAAAAADDDDDGGDDATAAEADPELAAALAVLEKRKQATAAAAAEAGNPVRRRNVAR